MKHFIKIDTNVSKYSEEIIPKGSEIILLDSMFLESENKEMALILYKKKKYIIPLENVKEKEKENG